MEVEKKDGEERQQTGRTLEVINYKDVRTLYRFVSERGKIIPSRIRSQPLKRQREIATAIKRARILALLPFVIR
ncbi:MAG: 30S ribosomal protein S18 [Holosporales bacterium]|nr:30S ribosomal protein S18 [Holosporales bacterium]